MSLLEGILLGLVQGLTEFLPISSSGHLVIVQHFLPGFKEPGLLFDLLLHVGTLIAAALYFRQDLKDIFCGLFAPKNQDEKAVGGRKLALLVIIGSLPTAIIGLAFKDIFEQIFNQPQLVAVMFLVTAGMLFSADRIKRADHKLGQMSWLNAILIGTIQGFAIIPGISRSGSTIATGIFCKIDRDLAARYSFLLMLPAVAGATLLEARHLFKMWEASDSLMAMVIGTLTASIVGYLTIDVLMRLVRNQRLSYFAYYCIAIGLGTFVLLSV